MRLLSISILIVAGALLIAVGAICEAFNRNGSIDDFAAVFGTLLALAGTILFFVEWTSGLATSE